MKPNKRVVIKSDIRLHELQYSEMADSDFTINVVFPEPTDSIFQFSHPYSYLTNNTDCQLQHFLREFYSSEDERVSILNYGNEYIGSQLLTIQVKSLLMIENEMVYALHDLHGHIQMPPQVTNLLHSPFDLFISSDILPGFVDIALFDYYPPWTSTLLAFGIDYFKWIMYVLILKALLGHDDWKVREIAREILTMQPRDPDFVKLLQFNLDHNTDPEIRHSVSMILRIEMSGIKRIESREEWVSVFNVLKSLKVKSRTAVTPGEESRFANEIRRLRNLLINNIGEFTGRSGPAAERFENQMKRVMNKRRISEGEADIEIQRYIDDCGRLGRRTFAKEKDIMLDIWKVITCRKP